MSNKPKTIFCDIDGTLWDHVGVVSEQVKVTNHKLLKNTKEAIDKWDKLGYKIILTTGRKESLRDITVHHLKKLGIAYDNLIMGLGGGDRILINDRKSDDIRNTAYSINLCRNEGLHHYDFSSDLVTVPNINSSFNKKNCCIEEIIELNDIYMVKKITIKSLKSLDFLYHKIKKKTIFIVEGKLKIQFKNYINNNIFQNESLILSKFESQTILPFDIHKIECIEDCTYIETSTIELDDEVSVY